MPAHHIPALRYSSWFLQNVCTMSRRPHSSTGIVMIKLTWATLLPVSSEYCDCVLPKNHIVKYENIIFSYFIVWWNLVPQDESRKCNEGFRDIVLK